MGSKHQPDFSKIYSGVIRKVDEVGRVCIPKSWHSSINLKDKVEVFRLKDGIFIKPYQESDYICKWCGEEKELPQLKKIDDYLICEDCHSRLKSHTE